MSKLKIFVAYHKKTPVYKSDIYEPLQVGTDVSDLKFDMLHDNTGDNISKLNKYYCELTGHYWVLKNYIDSSPDDYIGFTHYRRFMDIEGISDTETPSIYGLSLSEADNFFQNIAHQNLAVFCENYDILLPSKVYMYKDTVNPILREGENLNFYEHFKSAHQNDLLDGLKDVFKKHFPDYLKILLECFNSKKAYFYNMYIMKKNILKEFLTWEFEVLNKLGENIGGWENSIYYRMAGFVGEQLINIWLKKRQNIFKIGYFPIYMIDFEYDYIEKINQYISQNNFKSAINELYNLLEITDNKQAVYRLLYELHLKINDTQNAEKYYEHSIKNAQNADDYYDLARTTQELTDNKDRIINLYKTAIEKEPDTRLYINSLLYYSKQIHDLITCHYAWEKLNALGLNDTEKEKYEHFLSIYKMVHKQ